MTAYIPPKKGTDDGAQIGAPIIGPRRGGGDAGTAAGENVLARNSGTTDAWLAAQRNAYANSIVPLHTATLDHPEVQATYRNHYGVETVTLSPTVAPGGGGTTEGSELQPPNDLLELAQTEIVTPETPLYLMVLFGVDEIAAFDMEALDNPAPIYVGKCQKTQWTLNEGAVLRTFQAKFANTEWVLIPIDLTGQKAYATYVLSTNALGDGIETQALQQQVPLMNSDGHTVWTMGGSYQVIQGKLQLVKSLPTGEGGLPTFPATIAADGTCTYLAEVIAGNRVGYSQETLGYTADNQVAALVNKKRSDAAKDLPTVQVKTPALASLTTTVDDQVSTSTLNSVTHNTIDYEATIVVTQGPVTAPVVAYSYTTTGAFGDVPSINLYVQATGTRDILNYDLGTNATSVSHLAGSNLASLALPVMSFTLGDRFDVAPQYVSAIYNSTITLTPGTGRPVPLAYAAGWTSGQDGQILGSTYHVTYFGVAGEDPTNTVSHAPVNDAGSAHDRYNALVQAMTHPPAGQQQVVGTKQVGMTQLVLTVTSTNNSLNATTQGDYNFGGDDTNGPIATVFPPDVDTIDLLDIGVGISSSAGNFEYFSYSRMNSPQSHPYTQSGKDQGTIQVFKETLTYDGDSPNKITDLIIHTMPPMMGDKPYYSLRANGDATVTVVTPYGNFDGHGNGAAFTPWLHVSNGKHVIQGFHVLGQPHAYLDGGSTDWLVGLARSLKVSPLEIVTMVMDVTMPKIKAVAHVMGDGFVPTT